MDETKKPTLVSVGYLNIDLVAQVSCLPGEDQRITAISIKRMLGGMAANVACSAAAFGPPWEVQSELITSIGDDAEGDWAISEIQKRGVSTRWITRNQKGHTTYCIILVEPNGRRAIISEPLVLDDAILLSRFKKVEGSTNARYHVHVDGYRVPHILPYLNHGRHFGWTTSIDLDGLDPRWCVDSRFPVLLSYFDFLFINRNMAKLICPEITLTLSNIGEVMISTPFERRLKGMLSGARPQPQALIFTLGEEGLVVFPSNQSPYINPPVHVDTKDTTGAGDVFAGTFLAAWLNGESIERAVRVAAAAAALSTTGTGALGYLPTAQEAKRLAQIE